jgi:hypothetical protein
LTLGVIVGALLVWMLTGAGERGDGLGRGALDSPEDSFSLSGDLTEVVLPGVFVPLDLSITNSNETALLITELVVAVSGVAAPNATDNRPCTVDDFEVKPIDDQFTLVIEAGATASLSDLDLPRSAWPHVGMPIDETNNQDGCKGASLTLSYSARARADQ